MRPPYPSDISRDQFEQIRPLLEGARKKTAPRKVDLYEVFCAVLYLLRSGCQWRMLPDSFPKWRTVHAYFQIWSEVDDKGVSLLERALTWSIDHCFPNGRACMPIGVNGASLTSMA